jgi:heme exporter protein B
VKKFLGKVLVILWKDILAELRTRDIVVSMLVFSLLVIVIFNFTFDPNKIGLVASGVLWVALTFAGVLGLNRSFVLEKEDGCLQGLMLCPLDRGVIYLGKMVSSLIFMLVVAVIVLPVFFVLFNLPSFRPELVLIVVLATIGFASVGTLFSALAVNTKAREIMLPILFFPIVVPVIIAAVKATEQVIAGESWSSLASWLQVMAAFDIIFLVVSSMVFEFIIEE